MGITMTEDIIIDSEQPRVIFQTDSTHLDTYRLVLKHRSHYAVEKLYGCDVSGKPQWTKLAGTQSYPEIVWVLTNAVIRCVDIIDERLGGMTDCRIAYGNAAVDIPFEQTGNGLLNVIMDKSERSKHDG